MTWNGQERRQDSPDLSELKELILSLDHKVDLHIVKEEETVQALKELVVIWKGSKVIIPFMAAVTIGAWAFYEWFRDHIK